MFVVRGSIDFSLCLAIAVLASYRAQTKVYATSNYEPFGKG